MQAHADAEPTSQALSAAALSAAAASSALGAVHRCTTAKVSSLQQWSAVQPPLGHSRNIASESKIDPAAQIDASHCAPLPLPVPLPLAVGACVAAASHPGTVPHARGVAQYSAFDCALWHAMQSATNALQHATPLLSTPPLLTQCAAHIAIVGHSFLTTAYSHIGFGATNSNDGGV